MNNSHNGVLLQHSFRERAHTFRERDESGPDRLSGFLKRLVSHSLAERLSGQRELNRQKAQAARMARRGGVTTHLRNDIGLTQGEYMVVKLAPTLEAATSEDD